VITVVDVDARTDHRWHDLVGHANASLFHGAAWSAVLADTYGFEPRALLTLDDGRVVNGVPWCVVSDPAGSRIVSLPFSDYCGPIGSGPFAPLLGALVERQLPVRVRNLVDADSDTDDAEDGFRTVGVARWHGVPVTQTPDVDAWHALAGSTRRAITKARRGGVVVVDGRDDPELLVRFRRLHTGVRKRKYRLLPQPPTFFESICNRFGATGDWYPLAAVREGEVLAVTVYLRHRDTLFYKFNASDPDHLDARPNDLLLWAGVELAARLGCRLVDLGASDDAQPGLVRFKRGFGAVEREIRTRVAGPPAPDGAVPFRAVLHEFSLRLTAPEVSDALTETAGARLYRYFA
jgi:CelD/BcsL family acetyltransferase involved in cellulose biosynthesis